MNQYYVQTTVLFLKVELLFFPINPNYFNNSLKMVDYTNQTVLTLLVLKVIF